MPFSDNDCESQESHALILALHLQVHSFTQEQMGAPAMMTQTPTEICALLDKALMLNTVVFPLTVLCCPVLCDPRPQAVLPSLLHCGINSCPCLCHSSRLWGDLWSPVCIWRHGLQWNGWKWILPEQCLWSLLESHSFHLHRYLRAVLALFPLLYL